MPGGLRVRVAVGGVLLLPLACDWEEFHACEGDECTTITAAGGTGGTSPTSPQGGSSAGGFAGIVSTTGLGGTSSSAGGSFSGSATGGGEGGAPGTAGAAGEGGSPAMCDGELAPGDDACVVDEEFGLFVSPSGDDATGDGTREAPYATLQKAANIAGQSGKRVYACATGGDYLARVSLGGPQDGLELFGSFDCSDWSYDSDLRAKVAPETGVALRIYDIVTRLELEGFSFESPDATEAGTSSIAAEIRESSNVVLRNVALRAGTGANGVPGATGTFTHPKQSELDGVNGTVGAGGVMASVECPAGDTTLGGDGGGVAPTDGGLGAPNYEGPGGEAGEADGESCVGQGGANGPAGVDGEGATTRGALVDEGWVPQGGADGSPGLSGQGGGGGAGAANGGGGSGGAGSCGLAGGRGGGGGGASIALLLVDAEVTLVDSEVAAGDAGRGAPGGVGERRTSMAGNPGAGFGDGCDGGRGGLGGNGGGGGGGAGGISVGILFQGTAPIRMNTDVSAGIEGDGGVGGGDDNDGIDGFAEPEIDAADV